MLSSFAFIRLPIVGLHKAFPVTRQSTLLYKETHRNVRYRMLCKKTRNVFLNVALVVELMPLLYHPS